MPRQVRAKDLQDRANRFRLQPRRKPYFVAVARGVGLGYRRLQGAGTWTVRGSDGKGGAWTKSFATADDNESSNSTTILDFWQASDRARQIAREANGDNSSDRPLTVREAITSYKAELEGRGGDSRNVSRLLHNLPKALGERTVSLLNARELREWRNGLVKQGLAPASADRTARVLKASLSLASREDSRITNTMAWRAGLSRLPDSERPRNIILTDDEVRRVIRAAYAIDPGFGLYVEAHSVTGARSSQLEGLKVCDLQDGTNPRLMMPSSKKGRRRRIERRPVPIPTSLAKSLRLAAVGRNPHHPLLQPPVCRRQLFAWFKRVAVAAGLDPEIVSIYSLRHSAIVRMLLAGIPIRAVASVTDTSSMMIEKNYSAYIGDHSDALIRRALLDVAAPASTNVIPMSGARA